MKRFAAIDVGSFDLELGIYEIGTKTGIKKIEHIRHLIPLGSDTYTTGKISYKLMQEMCDVMADFKRVMDTYKVDAYQAYATSAMREAANRHIVIDQVRVRSGIDIQIISNSEQRFISYMAVSTKGDTFESYIREGTLIADVGFGSMQLTIYDEGTMVSTQNLSLGVLRLRELVDGVEEVGSKRRAALREIIDNDLSTYKKIYLKSRNIKNLICIGDPILYLLSKAGLLEEDHMIRYEHFHHLFNKVKSMSATELEDTFSMTKKYASVILPTIMVYHRIFELVGAKEVWLVGVQLIDGIVAEYAHEHRLIKGDHSFTEDIVAAARNISKKYRGNSSHLQAVESYALSIFDELGKVSGLTKRDRLILQIATILHNCGKFISMRYCAIATHNIISTAEIIGLSHDERMMVAAIASGNQGDNYKNQDIRFSKLYAILRIANALDRSHRQKVEEYRFKKDEEILYIHAKCIEDMSLEFISVAAHREFFKEIFGIDIVLKQIKTLA